MSSYLLRFVGAAALPKSISQQDIDEGFALSDVDVAAIRSSFKSAGRLGAAVQLVFLRATGRWPDIGETLPPLLLQTLCKGLGLSHTEIASLRTLYRRPNTRLEHQYWARDHAGFTEFGPDVQIELSDVFKQLSTTAISVDDLVQQGQIWLYEHRHVLPADRPLRDSARSAFAEQEAACLAAVMNGVPERQLNIAMSRLFASRGNDGTTVLEWLRTPPAKHSSRTLSQITRKLTFLVKLRVHEWELAAMPLARLRAYCQAVIHRPPSATQRLSLAQRQLEVACFLRGTLQELTDQTAEMGARVVCDLYRNGRRSVERKQFAGARSLREERDEIKTVLYDAKLTDTQKVDGLKKIIPADATPAAGSRAAMVRQTLVEEGGRQVSALLNAVSILQVNGPPDHRAMRQVAVLRDLAKRQVNELPTDFDTSMVDARWHPLLESSDRKKALSALKACTMSSLHRAVKGGQLWLAHSHRHRSREEQLIPPAQWDDERKSILRSMSLTDDVGKYLERVLGRVVEALKELAQAVEEGRVKIDEHGRLSLPPIDALDLPPEVSRTRDALYERIGTIQQGAMLVEVDARTGFSEILLGRKAKNIDELIALYGALLAHGTKNDAKGVALMIPGLQVSQITAAMRTMETRGRLQKANERVAEFQRGFPIAKEWGTGEKASADSMTVDTSRHLHAARMEYRRMQPGVGIYTHVMDSWSLFYNQPLVLNTRQAAPAVHGVEHYNATRREDQIKLSLLAVDTHGYTNAAMAVAKLLGFDLCVRLRNLSERMLYLPSGIELSEELERLRTGKVSLKKIRSGWDDLLRLVASIRKDRLSAREALERLGSAARGEKVHGAADELGKLLRTIFLCDYFSKPAFRREMHALLNRGESIHQLQRVVHDGRVGTQRGRRREELVTISGAHTLLTNAVICWNTMKLQELVDQDAARKHPIDPAWIRHIGPAHSSHINFQGVILFNLERYRDALLQGEPRAPERRAS